MNTYDEFFNKVISNKSLLDNLLLLKEEFWNTLSYRKRVDCFKSIVNEISTLYPELGMPKFDFKLLDDGAAGEDSIEGTYLNVKMIEDGNPFEILATTLHEMRHFYQRVADEKFSETGEVHPMFTRDLLVRMHVNLDRSILYSASNYIESSDINDVEYNLQPIEYDAENFSYEFMKRFKEKFLTSEIDIVNCEAGNFGFSKIKKIYNGNDYDIIDFNKIYLYNYEDMVKDNDNIFEKDRKIYDHYIKLIEKLSFLNDKQLFILMGPGFLEQFDEKTKCSLINCYLEFNKSESRIECENGEYFFNDLLVDLNEICPYILMEPFFLHVADLKVKEIVQQEYSKLNGIEKDIKLNLEIEGNIIKEEDNPLLYRFQPYVWYKYGFIVREYLKLIQSIDKPYKGNFNYFSDFKIFLKKYDNSSIGKKIEILYGKDIEEVYNDMISKMKRNLDKGNRTI